MRNITKVLEKAFSPNELYGTHLEYATKVAKKWDKFGLLEGLEGKKDLNLRLNVAMLLLNEAKHLIRESNYTSNAAHHELWTGIALPLIRRYLAKLAAKLFVTVQTMTRPTGLVFFIDHQFASDKSNKTFVAQNLSLYGTQFDGSTGDFSYIMDTNIATGLYGDGKFGYSLNQQQDGLTSTQYTVVSGSSLVPMDYHLDSSFSQSYATQIANGGIKKFSVHVDSLTYTPDLNGIQAFKLYTTATDDSCNSISKIFPRYTSLTTNSISFLALSVDGETGGTGAFAGEDLTLSYHRQTLTYDRGDFEWKGLTDIGIPEIKFQLTQKPIVPITRKLKALWTQLLIDDINAFLAIDGLAEISNQLSDQVAIETDLEIVSMIKKGGLSSGNIAFWSARPGYEASVNGTSVTFAENSRYMIQDKGQWFNTIRIPMQIVSNKVGQKTGRGGTNFAICSPTVATIFLTIEGFRADTDGTRDFFDTGFASIGSFQNRFKIYKNPYSVEDNVVILGYRGSGVLDFGAAYCPYIPLVMLPMIYEPTNFTPTKGVYTRYAKTMLRKDYYGALIIEGLHTL